MRPQCLSLCASFVLFTGCATFDHRAGFDEVSATVQTRSGKRAVWNLGPELDAQVAQDVHALLQDPLTADTAVQVALLNNRELQAIYSELGVAQADLVQAGLLANPMFDGVIFFPLAGGPVDVELRAAQRFLDLFFLPLRKRVAKAQFDAAKLQVTGAVLDFAATVQSAFYRHQADEQRRELLQTVAEALASSLAIARRLHAAGNIPDLALAREQAGAEEAKVQLRAAETTAQASREELNIFMGLWGQETAWHIERRLPAMPAESLPIEGLEARALRASIDLASARQQMIAAGEAFGVSRATALSLNPLLVRAENERTGRGKLAPSLSFLSHSLTRGKPEQGALEWSFAAPSRSTMRSVCGFVPLCARCWSRCRAQKTVRATTRTSSYHFMSASSVRASCTITQCSLVSLTSCAHESSRYRQPWPLLKRFAITGWLALHLGSSSVDACRVKTASQRAAGHNPSFGVRTLAIKRRTFLCQRTCHVVIYSPSLSQVLEA
jgi:hypothetical protein